MNKFLVFYKHFLILIGSFFGIHLLVFKFTSLQETQVGFYYSISFLYLVFFILATLSLFVVVKTSEKNFDNTGMVFMLVTTIQTIIAYIIVRPLLNNIETTTLEKGNYFFIFILFLAIETLVSIRLLNKK